MMRLRRRFGCFLVLAFLPAAAVAAQDVVLAPGEGSPPIVRVLHRDGTQTSFYAYDPAFMGGVRVALGDVNGDGIPDIITAAGPGGGPHVEVFSGKDLSMLASFLAYNPAFTGGVYVAAGDLNGDGRADIITGAGAGGGPHVEVFSGADLSMLASFFAYGAGFTGGVRVAAGDIDRDGHADIITGAGPGGGPHVEVFSGADLSMLASYFAYDAAFTGGVFVASGDFDGDGHADIVTGAGPGGGPHVEVFSGADLSMLASFFAYAPAFTGGVAVGAVDVDGDGRTELITGAGPGGGPHVEIFSTDFTHLVASFLAFEPSFGGGVFVGSMPGGSTTLRITSAPNASFTVGSFGTFTVNASGGTGSVTLTETGALPAGVTFTDEGNRTATLTGTPGAGSGGTYPLTFTATDSRGKSDTQTLTLTIQESVAITSANAVSFTLGAANSFSVTTTGFPRPALTVTGALPQGVMFTDNGNGTGTLTGTPAAGTGGPHRLTITASNSVKSASVQRFTLNVTLGPADRSQIFSFTGASETFVVPSGVTALAVSAFGAAGGSAGGTGGVAAGGLGGSVSATLAVTPGETLVVVVGGTPPAPTGPGLNAPGFNGGGQGWSAFFLFVSSGSGGGATDIRRGGGALANRVVVAGGGGGAGASSDAPGGGGGGTTGGNGYPQDAGAGGGGTQTAGGAGGAFVPGPFVGSPGTMGSLGAGGDGGILSGQVVFSRAGGGGGGGYFGGGGGAISRGGGGGSSYADPAATGVVHVQGIWSGDGLVIFMW